MTEFTWTSLVELGVLDPADDSVARHHVRTDHNTRGLAFDEMDEARVPIWRGCGSRGNFCQSAG